MSMRASYARITLQELAELKRRPNSIMQFLESIEGAEQNGRCLDIEKAWHGIHFLLLGTPWGGKFPRDKQPLWNAIMGGTSIGKIDLGYGPARYLMPSQVKDTAKALGKISQAELRSRFNIADFDKNEIYPAKGSNEDEDTADELLNYLMGYYIQLVIFFQETAKSDDAMLLYVT